jgi:hypothetical protein
VRMGFSKLTRRYHEVINTIFKQAGIDHLELSTNSDYLPHLHRLFKERIRRRYS